MKSKLSVFKMEELAYGVFASAITVFVIHVGITLKAWWYGRSQTEPQLVLDTEDLEMRLCTSSASSVTVQIQPED